MRRVLQSESVRSWIAAGAMVATCVVWMLPNEKTSPETVQKLLLESLTATGTIFLVIHVTLTLVAFHRCEFSDLQKWADGQESSWYRRWIKMNEPGGGLAVYFALLALAGGLLLLPNPERAAHLLNPSVITLMVGLLIFVAWVAVAVTHAVAYALAHHHGDEGDLEFPGTAEPGFSEYLYFSFMVMCTFGTTDVLIRSRAIRHRVLTHSIIAFIFNTVILASVVGMLTARAVG